MVFYRSNHIKVHFQIKLHSVQDFSEGLTSFNTFYLQAYLLLKYAKIAIDKNLSLLSTSFWCDEKKIRFLVSVSAKSMHSQWSVYANCLHYSALICTVVVSVSSRHQKASFKWICKVNFILNICIFFVPWLQHKEKTHFAAFSCFTQQDWDKSFEFLKELKAL